MPGIVLDLGDSSTSTFPGDGVQVLGDDEGLRKVFSNIFENAREAMGGAGRILLRVEPAENGEVLVRVGDEGTGVSPEVRERLFEPYFSTKTTGTGLGLAITRSILEEIGGTISLSNRTDGGAEVRITLPGS
jgi:signal transduction histidine kinase